MAATEFALNDPLAVQRWSNSLAHEAEVKQYFRKFMGKGDDALIKVKTELNKAAGEKIIFALRMKVGGDAVEDDNQLEGTTAEKALVFFNDSGFIKQRRISVKSKGKMTEQRVPYNLRHEARNASSTYWAEDYDQQLMMYLAGARGIDTSFHVGLSWTGRANNSLRAPDSDHILYGGTATGKADLDSADPMALSMTEKLIAKAETLDPMIQPFRVQGESKFVLLMHTFQAYALRTSTSENDWVDIQKNAGLRGEGNHLYHNALGEYGDVILHKHRNVIRFDDYGSGGDVNAARALFLGAQAAVIAWGGGGAYGRYNWNEEKDDRGNALVVSSGYIGGCSKTRFNSKDFGVIAVDTYVADPNA